VAATDQRRVFGVAVNRETVFKTGFGKDEASFFNTFTGCASNFPVKRCVHDTIKIIWLDLM